MYPILFSFNEFEVYALGIFYLLAFAVFNFLVVRLSSGKGMKLGLWNKHVTVLTVVCIVCARIGHVIAHWPDYQGNPLAILLPDGFSYYGGILGFVVVMASLAAKRKENLLAWTDLSAVAFFGWLAISSLGHFLNGSNYGIPTDLPWGVTYDNISAAVLYTVPVHPVQIYQALFALVMLGISWTLYRSTSRTGLVTFVSGFALGLFDFLIMFLRGDEMLMLGPLKVGQVFALVLLAFCSSFLLSLFLRQVEE